MPIPAEVKQKLKVYKKAKKDVIASVKKYKGKGFAVKSAVLPKKVLIKRAGALVKRDPKMRNMTDSVMVRQNDIKRYHSQGKNVEELRAMGYKVRELKASGLFDFITKPAKTLFNTGKDILKLPGQTLNLSRDIVKRGIKDIKQLGGQTYNSATNLARQSIKDAEGQARRSIQGGLSQLASRVAPQASTTPASGKFRVMRIRGSGTGVPSFKRGPNTLTGSNISVGLINTQQF